MSESQNCVGVEGLLVWHWMPRASLNASERENHQYSYDIHYIIYAYQV